MTQYLTSLEKSISNCLGMKDGWDGRGSAAPTPEAIRAASAIWACPLGHGGLQIELHTKGVEVDIEIDSMGNVTGVAWSKS